MSSIITKTVSTSLTLSFIISLFLQLSCLAAEEISATGRETSDVSADDAEQSAKKSAKAGLEAQCSHPNKLGAITYNTKHKGQLPGRKDFQATVEATCKCHGPNEKGGTKKTK